VNTFSEAESFSTLTEPIMPVAYHAERADMRTNGIADVRGERLWLDQEPYLDAFAHFYPLMLSAQPLQTHHAPSR
jgi:hypothetical protein